MVKKTIHDQAYEVISWDDIGELTFRLAQKILATNQKYDRLIALARGGVSITQALADALAVKKISVVQTEMYTGINEKMPTPVVIQPLASVIKDERVLVVDDLADSGETLLFISQYLCAQGPKDIKMATLFRKPWTKVSPDFYVADSESWVIFPWEVRETIQTLMAMWTSKGDHQSQIEENLQSLGYTNLQIETYSKS